MAKKITFTPETEQDADNGYFWYESNRIGSGQEFLTAVDACFQSISRNPKTYQVLYKSDCKAVVRRFSYAVLYKEIDTEVKITASRQPFLTSTTKTSLDSFAVEFKI